MNSDTLDNSVLAAPGGEILDLGGKDGDAIFAQKEDIRIAAVLFDHGLHGMDGEIGAFGIPEAEEVSSHEAEKSAWLSIPVSMPGMFAVMLSGLTEVRFECDAIRRHINHDIIEFSFEGRLVARFGRVSAWGRVDAMEKGGAL